MSTYTIKCIRTGAIIQFEPNDLELFKAQFYNINGLKENFYNYYEIIDFIPTTTNTDKGSQPVLEFKQHEVGRHLPPTLDDNNHGFPPINLFFLDIFK